MVGNLGDDRGYREGIAVEAAMSFYGAHANMVRGTFCENFENGVRGAGCGVREGALLMQREYIWGMYTGGGFLFSTVAG